MQADYHCPNRAGWVGIEPTYPVAEHPSLCLAADGVEPSHAFSGRPLALHTSILTSACACWQDVGVFAEALELMFARMTERTFLSLHAMLDHDRVACAACFAAGTTARLRSCFCAHDPERYFKREAPIIIRLVCDWHAAWGNPQAMTRTKPCLQVDDCILNIPLLRNQLCLGVCFSATGAIHHGADLIATKLISDLLLCHIRSRNVHGPREWASDTAESALGCGGCTRRTEHQYAGGRPTARCGSMRRRGHGPAPHQ